MAEKYANLKKRQNNIIFTFLVAFLICAVFLMMITVFYQKAEDEAYEMLHIQTKQIKDDLILQIKSDTENLVTMASFASKLNARGEDYSLMFDSFKPIGLFSRIGILTPECMFITKDETVDLKGKISFEREAQMGKHITGRTYSYSRPDEQVLRSAVPIMVNNRTVGIIYGIISIEGINEKYNNMAKELDAQLFVYGKDDGLFIIDSINTAEPGKLSELKDRKYNDDYSYEKLVTTDKGFTSFESIRTGENLYLHYSTIEDFDWGIMLARYESQVFAQTHAISRMILLYFVSIVVIIVLYLIFILKNESRKARITAQASGIRKLLLDVNQQEGNVVEALKTMRTFSVSDYAFFADTDGEYYSCSAKSLNEEDAASSKRTYFIGELFGYAAKLHSIGNQAIGFMRIVPDNHLLKTNPGLYDFFNENGIRNVCFKAITDQKNHVSILGLVNAKKEYASRELLKDIAVCFSISIYNKKHLNKTEYVAMTDSLTGVNNRVSYKKDILLFDAERPSDFSCIYIDVNELHLRNNKYGHAAGDEMLIYIANSLNEVFFGHRVYRMGGDEFLVFTKGLGKGIVKDMINVFIGRLELKGYTVAIGISFKKENPVCEEMVREAEVRMYEAKAQFYQDKENHVSDNQDESYIHIKTGIMEIDTLISVLKEHYNGIYRVNLESDNARRILMPSYFGYSEDEKQFSNLLSKYIDDFVHPDFRRALVSFLNYDAIKRQLKDGKNPSITYKKSNGDTVILSVYKLEDDKDYVEDTLWVFAKD